MVTAMLTIACGSKSMWPAKGPFVDMLDAVFKKRCAPRYHGCLARSGHVAAFTEKLRAVPSLFFAPKPESDAPSV